MIKNRDKKVSKYYKKIESSLDELTNLLKVNKFQITDRVKKLLEERKALEKKIRDTELNSNSSNLSKLSIEKFKDFSLHYSILSSVPAKSLKDIIDKILKGEEKVCALFSINEKKVTMVVGITNNLSKKISAIELVRSTTPIIGGKGGGGRDNLAQGGGDKLKKLDDAIKNIIKLLKNIH